MRGWIPAALTVAACVVGVAMAEDVRAKVPEVGAAAPDFRLNDQDGKGVRLAELTKAGWTVLAFFPKALTPG